MAASTITLEGIVENGQIKLARNISLPESARVYAVIPGPEPIPTVRIASPRLAHRKQVADFEMQVENYR